jgi:hypothetical protein
MVMSVNEKMTAIADGVRTLSGESGKMGLDAMSEKIAIANTTVDGQSDLIYQIKVALRGKTAGSGEGAKEEQEKTVNIKENGPTEVIPDENKTLSKVVINVNVPTQGGNDYELFAGVADRSILNIGSEATQNIKQIGNHAFYYCTQLQTANFPVCTEIKSFAFAYCWNLTSVSFPACEYVRTSAFLYCSNFTSISFPAVTYLESYAFAHCNKLSEVTFPVCRTIGPSVFRNCSNLTTATFSASYIQSSAFTGCSNLMSFTNMYTSVAALASSKVFYSTPMSTSSYTGAYGSIYVPASLVAAYKAKTNWTVYADRITSIPE